MTDKPPWWPKGVAEHHVQNCNCEYCNNLAQALADHRDGQALDGEHKAITEF